MRTSNLNLQEKGKEEGKKSTIKRWASNSNNNENAHNFSIVKFPQIGKGLSFVVGDNWTDKISDLIFLYSVISVEDVIIPAGRYRCFKISEKAAGCQKNYYWFAPDIGLVKFDIGGIKGSVQGFSYE